MRLILLGTLRGLIIQPTRDIFCNVIDNQFEFPTFRMINEQSVDDALCMFCKRIYYECAAKLLKICENKNFIVYWLKNNYFFNPLMPDEGKNSVHCYVLLL